MYADSSKILEESASDPPMLRDEVTAVFDAFERLTGFQLVLRLMSDRWRDADGLDVVPVELAAHRTPFCVKVKAQSFEACHKCDNTELPGICSPPQGPVVEPFVRTCHAGGDEVLLPLWDHGVLVAVLFVGQFKAEPDGHRETVDLRQLGPADTERLRTVAWTLRSYFLDVLHRLDAQRGEKLGGRRGAIEAYVRENLSTKPTLRDLAAKLSLSPSRTSHIVRELTGNNFQELVADRRLAVAKDLLAGSDGTVTWIAHQVGFADTGYFCHFFKRNTGTTPTDFRHKSRRRISV